MDHCKIIVLTPPATKSTLSTPVRQIPCPACKEKKVYQKGDKIFVCLKCGGFGKIDDVLHIKDIKNLAKQKKHS